MNSQTTEIIKNRTRSWSARLDSNFHVNQEQRKCQKATFPTMFRTLRRWLQTATKGYKKFTKRWIVTKNRSTNRSTCWGILKPEERVEVPLPWPSATHREGLTAARQLTRLFSSASKILTVPSIFIQKLLIAKPMLFGY